MLSVFLAGLLSYALNLVILLLVLKQAAGWNFRFHKPLLRRNMWHNVIFSELGQAGVAVGYKYVFLAFEFTFVRLIMNGDLSVLQKPMANFDLSSNIVYPSLGLMGEF